MELTQRQREAVEAPDRVLCIVARAGTGKTRVLTERITRRIADGSASPAQVLAVTFSRKAAGELRGRLAGRRVRTGTFHGTALALVSEHRASKGRPAPQLLEDRRAILEELTPNPGAAEVEIGWAKARLFDPDAYAAAGRRPPGGFSRMAETYARYESERRRRGLLDFDDLLWEAGDALDDDRGFGQAVQWRNRHLFVDEVQDMNPAQYRLLRGITGSEPDLCAVGDPDQAIYGWNGAERNLLDRIARDFPGTRTIRLEENHRSTPEVLSVANSVLGIEGVSTGRPSGPRPRARILTSPTAEAQWVAGEILRGRPPGGRWRQTAVLARTNRQLLAIAEALTSRGVPHEMLGGGWGPGRPGKDPDQDRTELSGDAVVLATFHRSKGLQWRRVFVIGLSEGLVPHAAAKTDTMIDEERRLLYVALTRAEEELVYSAAGEPVSRWWRATGDDEPIAEATGHIAELRRLLGS